MSGCRVAPPGGPTDRSSVVVRPDSSAPSWPESVNVVEARHAERQAHETTDRPRPAQRPRFIECQIRRGHDSRPPSDRSSNRVHRSPARQCASGSTEQKVDRICKICVPKAARGNDQRQNGDRRERRADPTHGQSGSTLDVAGHRSASHPDRASVGPDLPEQRDGHAGHTPHSTPQMPTQIRLLIILSRPEVAGATGSS